jgi:hypothetical protein
LRSEGCTVDYCSLGFCGLLRLAAALSLKYFPLISLLA